MKKKLLLLLCIVFFPIVMYSASIDSKKKFRKEVLCGTLLMFKEKCNQYKKLKDSCGSPEYQRKMQDILEEIVDFSEIVCDGATHYHEEKITPQDMILQLQELKSRPDSPISRSLVKDFLQEVSEIPW